MNSNHTAGNWQFQTSESNETVNGLPIIEVSAHFDDNKNLSEWIAKVRGNTEKERLANAKIMAQSPTMLSELKTNHDFLLALYTSIGDRKFDKENALQLLRDRMAKQLEIIKSVIE